MLIKDGITKTPRDVRALHPTISFAESTYAELGWNEYVPPTPPPLTPEQIKAQLSHVVQMHLDTAATVAGYDNIVSACSYAGAPNQFQAEGQSFLVWRGDVWSACFTIMTEVEAGTRPIPTKNELLALLPMRTP